jgi:hypothetical protein
MKIHDLKDTINRFTTRKSRDPDDVDAARIIANPNYAKVLEKLDELYRQREFYLGQLEKIELDIDACLLLVSMNERKAEINREENKNS